MFFTLMKLSLQPGSYSKQLITDQPADLNSEEAQALKKRFPKFPEEAIYIYSFKENKMVYADGWEEVLGYRDDEISMLKIVEASVPEHSLFSYELNDKALQFLNSKTKDLELYSFTIEIKKTHRNGKPVPLILRVAVFKSEGGKVKEIIGHAQINRSLKFGKVMKYYAYGPEKSEFEENLNKKLFRHFAISGKEKEAISLVAEGFTFKEIAQQLNVSQSAIEKRIIPMYKRFNVKSLSHLISFSIENNIIP